MPDEKKVGMFKVVVISIVTSAVFATAFGFCAGFIAGNGQWNAALLGAMPMHMRRLLEPPEASVGPEKYALPFLRGTLKQVGQEQAIIDVVKKASPAVVSIVISKDVPVMERYFANPEDNNGGAQDFFQQFFQDFPGFQFNTPQYRQNGTQKQDVGAGTGFFVSADGYIVTNRHVVQDEAAEYTVITHDNKKLPAKVVGRDPVNDIAVLKVEGKDFPSIALGDSDKVEVGQSVIAIGYALGQFDNTVSAGIISGLQRSLRAGDGLSQFEDLSGVIQTDAAINPGNSGGPLLDLRGEAVGINVAIVQGSQSIAFALPINDVKKVVDSVKTYGKIVRPFIGVRYIQVNKDLKEANQLTVDYGVLVVRGDKPTDLAVMPGSPADVAGIVENDIILEIDGQKITEDNPLQQAINKHAVGDEIKLKVLHRGEEKEIVVKLTERK
jgi:serine protease Do